MELSLESLTKNRSNIYLFSNGFSFECYSRFDQSRSHQTLVQMMASLSVVMIVDSMLAQYSEGFKKNLGLGAPPLLLKAHQLGGSSAEVGGKVLKY